MPQHNLGAMAQRRSHTLACLHVTCRHYGFLSPLVLLGVRNTRAHSMTPGNEKTQKGSGSHISLKGTTPTRPCLLMLYHS